MSEKKIENAILANIVIGLDEAKKLKMFLNLRFETSVQSYECEVPDILDNLSDYIKDLFRVFGYYKLDQFQNVPCRVETKDYKITRVGHFLEDRWFVAMSNEPSEFTPLPQLLTEKLKDKDEPVEDYTDENENEPE